MLFPAEKDAFWRMRQSIAWHDRLANSAAARNELKTGKLVNEAVLARPSVSYSHPRVGKQDGNLPTKAEQILDRIIDFVSCFEA